MQWKCEFKLYLILIGYDKKQYTKATINKIMDLTKNNFKFDVNKNVLDLNDIYQLITDTNSVNTYLKVRNILSN